MALCGVLGILAQHSPGRLGTLFDAYRSFWEGVEATTHPRVHLSLHLQMCSQRGLRGGHVCVLIVACRPPQATTSTPTPSQTSRDAVLRV